MRKTLMIVGALALTPLASCGGNGDDKLAERVEDAADNRADAMEQRADEIRDTGERRADAIDAADLNAEAMDASQKDAIVANQAPAVR